jgi:hypothetical protein
LADYSENATQLSAPRGEGAYVGQPTGSQSVVPPIVREIGNIFAQGVAGIAKNEAAQRKNSIVGNFVRTETIINDAVATGQMTPAQASARSRANFNQYAAGYSEYIGDFEAAGKALRGFTETGEVQETIKREREIRNADIDEARKSGFSFVPGMSKQAEDDQINAYKTRIDAEQRLDRLYKSNAEARAQGTYDQNVAEKQAKDMSFQVINEIAGSNLQAFQSLSTTLAGNVKSGSMTYEGAQAALTERFSNISAAMQAAARTNPELAGPYRTIFEQMNTAAQKLIDPRTQSVELEALENQLKLQQTRMKLVAMTDPKIAATVVANQLLPNNPSLALSSASEGLNAVTLMMHNPVSNTPGAPFVPQVALSPAEADAIKLLKGSLNTLKGGKVDNKELAGVQAANGVNNMLKQTGNVLNQGATPTQLRGLADFFASPEYASIVTNGMIDKEAAGTAKKTFQLLYEPTIVKGVQQKMEEFVYGQASFGQKQKDPVTIGQSVDITFTGSGIAFKAKPIRGVDPVEARSQQQAVQELNTAQKAINQLIHIGAHMEGSTDYRKYWEDNKHILVPSMFPDPKMLKPGQVVDGYEYMGGATSDPRSWRPKAD